MARRLSRREVLLLSGLALVGGWWMWRTWSQPVASTAAITTKVNAKGAKMEAAPVVHLDQLDKALVKYDPDGRDLFRYSPRPPTWAEVKRMRAEAEKARLAALEAARQAKLRAEAEAKAAAARAEWTRLHPQPPPPPLPPRVTFQFIGFIGPPDDRIAAFQKNDKTFLAKTGDVIQKDFKVKEIRYESVILAYTDPKYKDTAELPLSRGK